MPRLFGGPIIPGIDPVAVARRHISDQRIGLPQRTEVRHVRRDVIETQRRIDDVRIEFTAPAERETKARQHLFFRNLHAARGQQLLGASEDAFVHNRLDRRSPPGPKRYPDS